VLTCTIVTTAPNDFMAPIHDRMPVILGPEAFEQWLDPHPQAGRELLTILKPCPAEKA
jgi:putative SOS response-associated peptidase YedK